MISAWVSNQNLLLMFWLCPYLGLVLIDGWIHEKYRRVPMLELGIHIGIFISVSSFILFAFLGETTLCGIAILIAIPLLAVDEFKFHGGISVIERRIHYAADLSLFGFTLLWAVTVFTR